MPQDRDVTLHLVGPFRIIGSEGANRTPRGRKACALLAMLALAPEKARARKWLQDKLWSDRGEDQGAQSLRQTLSEIRRALGRDQDCFLSDGPILALDAGRVRIEVAPGPGWAADTDAHGEHVLLEGLDTIRDPEFEHWLGEQRARFAAKTETARRLPAAPEPFGPGRREAAPVPPLRLILEEAREVGSPRDAMAASALADIVTKAITDICHVEVLDHRGGVSAPASQASMPPAAHGLSLRSGVVHDAGGAMWRLVLADPSSQRLIGAVTAQQHEPGGLNLDDVTVLRELNHIVDMAVSSLTAPAGAKDRETASVLCRQAVEHLTRLTYGDFLIADRLFERASNIGEPRGLYLAWRGYLRIFMLIESRLGERQKLVEEATGFIRHALEREPRNSLVAAFAAHVHAFMRRSYVAAYELALRSVQLNRANALGWACLGVAECHLGKTQIGYRHALMAREIAGATPLRFQIDGLSCVASAMAGNLDQAVLCAEASHALSPRFAFALRYMAALYLLQNQRDKSWAAVRSLQRFEPDFSYDRLRDAAYPVAGLHRARLVALLPAREI